MAADLFRRSGCEAGSCWSLGQTGWEGAFDRLDDLAFFSEDEEIQNTAELALEEWHLYGGQLEDFYDEDDGEEFDEDED